MPRPIRRAAAALAILLSLLLLIPAFAQERSGTAVGFASIISGTISGITSFAIRDNSAAFDLTLTATSAPALTAGRALTIDMSNVAHTLDLGATANTITFPNTASYTLVGSGDTGTVTNTMLAGSIAASKLASTTGSGAVVLASNPTFGQATQGTTATFQSGTNGTDNQGGQIKIINSGSGVPTPNKYIKISSLGELEFMNSAYSATIITLTDAGAWNTIGGLSTSSTTASTSATTGALKSGGGIGAAGAIWAGTYMAVTGTTLPTQAAGTLGIGGIAAAPTLAANGEGDIFLTTAGGLNQIGKGSVGDWTLLNSAGSTVATVLAGTTTTQFGSGSGVPAHIASGQTTAPALTSCGTGSPSIVGTDTAGTVTMGTSATGCVITFNVAYAAAPHCVVTWQATPLVSQSYVISSTAITLTQTATSGDLVNYICVARSGG